MNGIIRVSSVLTMILASASAGDAEPLRYWGRHLDTSSGLIELGSGAFYLVQPGTEIAAWGRVKEINDRRLVVEQPITETEKRRMLEQGALPYDILEIHVPREDPRQPRGHALPPGPR